MAKFSTNTLSVGQHVISAHYNGDGEGETSTAVPLTQLVTGGAVRLAFVQQPSSNTSAGANITPPVTVAMLDSDGNTLAADTLNVTLTLTANQAGGTLSGSMTMAAVKGVATFSNLSIDKAGTGYVLTAADGALPSVASNAFNIDWLAFNSATFTPENPVVGQTVTFLVAASDPGGLPVSISYDYGDGSSRDRQHACL